MATRTDDPIASIAAQVGRRLSDHRRDRRLSLGDLARQTGLSKTALASLERGTGNPSLETLWRIAHALDSSVGELLEDPEAPTSRRLGADEGPVVVSSSGMRGRLLGADDSRHRTEVFELSLPAGSRFESEPHPAGTRELVVCTRGTVAAGPVDEPLRLGPADSATFPGSTHHVYAGVRRGGTAVLVMSYPPHA
jgi:XRE family transcriptional regulator, regulator of sulfur utilization